MVTRIKRIQAIDNLGLTKFIGPIEKPFGVIETLECRFVDAFIEGRFAVFLTIGTCKFLLRISLYILAQNNSMKLS